LDNVSAFNDFWQRLDARARTGMAAGVLLIAAVTIGLGMWLLRTDYQVLFADLAPQDAATMTAELDKMKIPYRLGGDGHTILVPAEQVYKTRLKLVGKELPLRGAVGLELFNSSEVGMTEFTQKVNYQRALQGELTRTILAIDEVQNVRVHLVMAEQALFKKNLKQAKASINIALKPGRTLDAAQVQGIQRLVGAAVPDIRPADVTIVDQHGVALTRRAAEGEEAGAGAGADNLDDKRALEHYLNKKVVEVLERTVGAGQGIASVDVTLGHSSSKTTTESVLGAQGGASGVLVRERRSSRDAGADADAAKATGANTNQEADYQVGRKVEQVVSGAGAVTRVNVAVVVRGNFDHEQLERLRDVVALAAGIDKARGDAVSVYSMDQLGNTPLLLPGEAAHAPAAAVEDMASGAVPAAAPARAPAASTATLLALGALLVAALALLAWRLAATRAPRQLSMAERQQLLVQVNAWLEAPAVHTEERI
jgi:flagellar M-ring protein FliF